MTNMMPVLNGVLPTHLPEKGEEESLDIRNGISQRSESGAIPHKKKVCILSIDGGGMRGIIPGRALAYLEEALQRKANNKDARIADYFDIAAGTSIGGILATMLFTAGRDGKPLFTGEETWRLIAEKGKQIFRIPKTQQAWAKLRGVVTPRYSTKYLEALLKQYLVRDNSPLTLRDTLKPMLIPCYNLETAGSFLFSRAWALIDEKWNFNLWEICRATSAVPSYFKPAKMRSTNGVTSCTAIDGGLTMNNPTAAAITHVLHNKVEFPGVEGTRDMLVLSLGTGQFDQKYDYGQVRHWGAFQWATPVVKIVLDGISDMVDHTVSMSFGDWHKQYLRVQVSGLPGKALKEMDDGRMSNVKKLVKLADEMLDSPCMEHLPYGGRSEIENTSNRDRLDWFAEQLILEHQARGSRTAFSEIPLPDSPSLLESPAPPVPL